MRMSGVKKRTRQGWTSRRQCGNIISQGFLMAEDLNGYFSSVFTKEDISSLPVADAKFQGAKSDYLGPLVVTPELVAKKIKEMKDNKSPGVDGIPPKLLMETVDQISIPLARVFNLSLKEGVVPFEWKEANIIPLFKKGSRNKSENYRPVSLTSVIYKLLERLIKDHMVDFLVKHKLLNSSKRSYEQKLACNIKNDSKSFYAYVRSKKTYKTRLDL